MKKVRIDFIAQQSVVIAINDNDETEDYTDKAVIMAEKWINKNQPYVSWEIDQRGNPEDAENEVTAVNEERIKVCPHCHEQYVEEIGCMLNCPYCGEDIE